MSRSFLLRRQDGIKLNNNDPISDYSSESSNSGLQQVTEEIRQFQNIDEDELIPEEDVPQELNIDPGIEVGAEEFALQNQR